MPIHVQYKHIIIRKAVKNICWQQAVCMITTIGMEMEWNKYESRGESEHILEN